MQTYLKTGVAAAALSVAAFGMSIPAAAQSVTYERLLNPEPENWLHVSYNYETHRHSPLDIINTGNVGDMVPLFAVDICGFSCTPNFFTPTDRQRTGGHPKEEAIPLVADGFLYIEDGLSKVSKIDVSSGDRGTFVWRYDPEITSYRNRKGVALYGDAVHVCVGDPRAVALDMNSGEVLYDTDLHAPVQPGTTAISEIIRQTMTGPPLVVRTAAGRNMHICARGGQHSGNHSIDGVDADTGELVWRRYSVPAPGEPGHQTWENDAWQVTSIGFWGHHTWDPEHNVLYTGTGDVWPSYDPEFRPGDNLFGASTLAIDVDTGEIAWYFQYVPNEHYDADHANNHNLYTNDDGVRVLSTYTRMGFWYQFDVDASMAGGISNFQGDNLPPVGAFMSAYQWVEEVSWTAGIDPKTGLPVEYDPSRSIQGYADYADGGTPREHIGEPRYTCPTWGGQVVGMEPTSLDLERGMAYAIRNDSCRTGNYITEIHDDVPIAISLFDGEGPTPCCWTNENINRGYSVAGLDINTGDRTTLASRPDQTDNESGVVGTAGGLLMTGWRDGRVAVYSKDTGEELWHFNTGSQISAAPITYAVDGRQYFAILVGGGRGSISGIPDETTALGGTPNLWVFGLPN